MKPQLSVISEAQRLYDQKQEIRELQRKQLAGEMKIMPANKDSSYEIRVIEKDFFHVKLIRKDVDLDTKTIREDIIIHICTKKDFDHAIKNNHWSMYDDVEIIHDPTLKTKAT